MEGSRVLQGESRVMFSEGSGLLLNSWLSLVAPVENESGGHESQLRAQQLAADVLSWFTQSQEPLTILRLEVILDEFMLSSFHVCVDDGTIQWVAEKLMAMHEECLQGNFSTVEAIREVNLKRAAHPPATKVS